jgi:alpha-L-fucosidase 2
LRVFPAVPAHWRDVAFRDLLTEGAFRVSAIRRRGRTTWVQVRATVDRRMRLRDPFAGEDAHVDGADARHEGEDWIADLEAGQTVTFTVAGESGELGELAAPEHEGLARLGLRG